MKYKVKCNGCGKAFTAEAQTYGRVKYRCPHCGKVVTCQVNAPSSAATAPKTHEPSRQPSAQKGQKASWLKRLWRGTARSASWSSSQVQTFNSKYEDAGLWLFFGFSILFVACVIGGLFLFAEMAQLIASGKSWLYDVYLELTR